jgi:hypothetical protein
VASTVNENTSRFRLREEKVSADRIFAILSDAKALAREYYHLTGKPLGVTGEVTEFEAARILGVELTAARPTRAQTRDAARVECRDRLGGVIHEYVLAA